MNYIITCQHCGKVLCNVEYQLKESITNKCARFFLCPPSIKSQYQCNNCPYFSEHNIITVICPYCKSNIEISYNLAILRIVPGDKPTMPKIYSSSIHTNTMGLSIASIDFKKSCTVITLNKGNENEIL